VKTRASATSSVKLKCESCALGVQANDQALRGMFFTEPALLNRQLLSDLLRPLAGLSFRLGVAAGLASVAVVGDDDFRKPFAQRTPRTSPTRPSRQSPPVLLLNDVGIAFMHTTHPPSYVSTCEMCCL
jgi:hypothetical protein